MSKNDKNKNHDIWIYLQDLKKKRANHYNEMNLLRKKILFIEKNALWEQTFISAKESKLYGVDNFDYVRSLKSWLLRFFYRLYYIIYKENMKECVDIFIV